MTAADIVHEPLRLTIAIVMGGILVLYVALFTRTLLRYLRAPRTDLRYYAIGLMAIELAIVWFSLAAVHALVTLAGHALTFRSVCYIIAATSAFVGWVALTRTSIKIQES